MKNLERRSRCYTSPGLSQCDVLDGKAASTMLASAYTDGIFALVARERLGGLRCVTDKVRQPYPAKGVACDGHSLQCREANVELRHACNMADFILWK
jgi:hypothetical protein